MVDKHEVFIWLNGFALGFLSTLLVSVFIF